MIRTWRWPKGASEVWCWRVLASMPIERPRHGSTPWCTPETYASGSALLLNLIRLPALQDDYDTFGTTAAEAARGAARREAASRPGLIPGLLPEELVVPVADSIGGCRGGGGGWGTCDGREILVWRGRNAGGGGAKDSWCLGWGHTRSATAAQNGKSGYTRCAQETFAARQLHTVAFPP